MSRTRFQRVAAIFEEALERDAAEREAFVGEACGGDEALRAEVEAMLSRHRPEEPGWMEAAQRSLLDEAAPAALPAVIGHYRVRRVLAAGAMGTVYEAEQDDPHRLVALKVLRQGLTTPTMLRRFRHEADFLGRLHHPHIAQVYEAATHDEGAGAQPWFAMEFVQGRTLTEHAEAAGLDVQARIELLLRICDAVQYAHDRGIIHRDLKPENILVDERGEPRILDFGIARATDADLQVTTLDTGPGVLMGTLPYMSPEQVSGHGAPDARSDVYALGVILYQLLAGRLPQALKGKSVPEAARIIQQEEPSTLGTVDRSFRGDLETIVAKALEKDPARRYATAEALVADLRRFLRDEPIVARPASTLYQLRKFVRRNPVLVGGVVVSFALLVAGIVGISRQLRETREEAARFRELNDLFLDSLALLSPFDEPSEIDASIPQAESLLENLARRLQTGFERWPETRADIHLRLGQTNWGVGRVDEAREQLEEAVRLRREHLGEGDVDTCVARLWLCQFELLNSESSPDLEAEALELAEHLARLPESPSREREMARRLVEHLAVARPGNPGARLAGMTGTRPQEWPQMDFGAQRTGHNPAETRIGPDNVATLQLAWSVRVLCSIRYSVAVVDDVAYYGHYCAGFVAAEAATGTKIWSRTLNGKHMGHDIADGVAYVLGRHAVHAFDALTGAQLWTWSGGLDEFHGAPTVVGDKLLVGARLPGTLTALERATGTPIWTVPRDGEHFAVDGGVIYRTEGSTLDASDLETGGLLWTATATGEHLSRPAVSGGLVYTHSDAGKLYAFDAQGRGEPDCEPLWVGVTEPLDGDMDCGAQAPAVADGRVYAGANGTMYAFDAAGCGGTSCPPIWATATTCGSFPGGSPAVANGVVYSTGGTSKLYAFDADTGAVLWEVTKPGRGYAMRSSPTVVDGRVYFPATFDHALYVYALP